jgi:hypothetical protein
VPAQRLVHFVDGNLVLDATQNTTKDTILVWLITAAVLFLTLEWNFIGQRGRLRWRSAPAYVCRRLEPKVAVGGNADFDSEEDRSRAESRVVAVLKVIKESGRQINYGTGKEVSAETIQDAKAPLEIHWYNDSYLDLPVGR